MKPDDDLIELECLRAVHATGTFPDGCDPATHMRRGHVEATGDVLHLTLAGAQRLHDLDSSIARDA